MATRTVAENVKKDRRSFFLNGGMGVFLGLLSSRLVVEVCVIPVFLHSCENWDLSEELLR